MSTAQYLANSILLERRGVHVVIWDDKGELVRALLVLLAAFDNVKIKPILLSSITESEKELRKLFELQPVKKTAETGTWEELLNQSREELLLLFIQQATSSTIGPLLNGWRSALAEPPGSLLVIRDADLMSFLREAPDLSSFIGPKIIDSSTILSIWSKETGKRIKADLPQSFSKIMKELPGEQPTRKEIRHWITAHPPVD